MSPKFTIILRDGYSILSNGNVSRKPFDISDSKRDWILHCTGILYKDKNPIKQGLIEFNRDCLLIWFEE